MSETRYALNNLTAIELKCEVGRVCLHLNEVKEMLMTNTKQLDLRITNLEKVTDLKFIQEHYLMKEKLLELEEKINGSR